MQCDLVYVSAGSHTSGNSSPVGIGIQRMCNIMEKSVDKLGISQ